MKISLARFSKDGELFYSVETVRGNKLEVLGEFSTYDEAMKHAHLIMRIKGEAKGDSIWNWDGTFYEYTGRSWRVNHVSG